MRHTDSDPIQSQNAEASIWSEPSGGLLGATAPAVVERDAAGVGWYLPSGCFSTHRECGVVFPQLHDRQEWSPYMRYPWSPMPQIRAQRQWPKEKECHREQY